MNEIETVLAERGSTYGEFPDHARIAQGMKSYLHSGPSWEHCPSYMREAMEMALHKFARVVNGDPFHRDNIVDAIGYLQLVLYELDRRAE